MADTIARTLGVELPLLAFSHCRDVVAAVTNAGGFGVLGASGLYTPEQLDDELSWIDKEVRGRPYGVDIVCPDAATDGVEGSRADLLERIPQAHRAFVNELLAEGGMDFHLDDQTIGDLIRVDAEYGRSLMEVALRHPIGLMANALGVPPAYMLETCREKGVPVAALVGAREHALKQVEAGVDIIVAQGYEAGGHTGEIATMVLVPEILAAVGAVADIPVLAAGGIVTGRQMAAAMALGAAGVWTGSVWLTTREAETPPATIRRMLEASSRDTVRSRSRTGKPSRQLRSVWTEAWDDSTSLAPLPMPLQQLLSEPVLRRADALAEAGDPAASAFVTYWVGQGVGLMGSVRSTRDVVREMAEDYVDAIERMQGLLA